MNRLERHILHRIQRGAVEPELEVEVRTGAEFAGVADDGDGIAGFDVVADFFQQGAVVLVKTEKVVAVLDADHPTGLGGEVRDHDRTVECRFDGFVRVGDNVDAVVPAHRVETIGEGSFQRREKQEASDAVGHRTGVVDGEREKILGFELLAQDRVLRRFS